MQDKVIVITGASSGIGEKLAEVVAARGARVVLAARRPAELSAVAARLGAGALAVACDVTRRADVDQLRDRALDRFGQIDVWVSNAGRGITRSVTQLTDEDFDDMMATNVKSVLYGIQAVVPHFRDRGRGHVITVSSMLGRIPMAPARSAYSAAKAAANSLMTSLRLELRAQFPDIHVSTVLPGVVATAFGANALHGGPDSRTLPNAQPVDEVARAIADLIEHPRPSSTPGPSSPRSPPATSAPRTSGRSRPAHRSRCRAGRNDLQSLPSSSFQSPPSSRFALGTHREGPTTITARIASTHTRSHG